jgi:hypothetical protein
MSDAYRKKTTINVDKVIEQTPITEELPPDAPTKTSEQFYKEQEDQEEPTELELLKIENEQLKDALHKTEQFKPGTLFLGTKSEKEIQEIKDELASGTTVIKSENSLDDDTVFQYLRDRAKETGKIIIIDRVGAGAIVQALAQYKTSFVVAELFLRVIK